MKAFVCCKSNLTTDQDKVVELDTNEENKGSVLIFPRDIFLAETSKK
jgi:hypothetical protein